MWLRSTILSALLNLVLVLKCLLSCSPAFGMTHSYEFVVESTSCTRLCNTKEILTVNGLFPGPTLYARRGDTFVVNVINHSKENLTLHWHGVKQPRNPWSDGPVYITQCPIQPGANFSYVIILSDEEGTVWWHAHSEWIRATVHGALVIYPPFDASYPFPTPQKEFEIILGEWWIKDIKLIYEEAKAGKEPEPSDAFTINGQPGDLYPCSKKDTFNMQIEQGKTYLLRVINAALNNALFLSIAHHIITIVGSDGSYTKPLIVDYITISPGETYDLLLVADQSPSLSYYMAASALSYVEHGVFDETTATAILTYQKSNSNSTDQSPVLPSLPSHDDTEAATKLTKQLRTLHTPADLPYLVHRQLFIAISMNMIESRRLASLNNISFDEIDPFTIDILEAYYKSIKGVFGVNFPDRPLVFYDFTADEQPDNVLVPLVSRQVKFLRYGLKIEIVFQGTSVVRGSDHPMHLHGASFYVVGSGFGNFDRFKDPATYNLVDPPLKNTISVPRNGWVSIRFRATNPGVWYMHCHIESHLTWGMSTVFIVKNGPTPSTSMLPPPPYMPPC